MSSHDQILTPGAAGASVSWVLDRLQVTASTDSPEPSVRSLLLSAFRSLPFPVGDAYTAGLPPLVFQRATAIDRSTRTPMGNFYTNFEIFGTNANNLLRVENSPPPEAAQSEEQRAQTLTSDPLTPCFAPSPGQSAIPNRSPRPPSPPFRPV